MKILLKKNSEDGTMVEMWFGHPLFLGTVVHIDCFDPDFEKALKDDAVMSELTLTLTLTKGERNDTDKD